MNSTNTNRAAHIADQMNRGDCVVLSDGDLINLEIVASGETLARLRTAHNAKRIGSVDRWVAWTIGTPPGFVQRSLPSGILQAHAHAGRCTI